MCIPILQSHWSLLLVGNKPKKFNFVHQTVSHQDTCAGWTQDYTRICHDIPVTQPLLSEATSSCHWLHALLVMIMSWSKFGSDNFPSSRDSLFGRDFQSSVMSKVEKDTTLSRAVAITKRSKWEKEASTFLYILQEDIMLLWQKNSSCINEQLKCAEILLWVC